MDIDKYLYDNGNHGLIFFNPEHLYDPNPLYDEMIHMGYNITRADLIANLFDTNEYDGDNPAITLAQGSLSNVGLSEYTNANFLSIDTIQDPSDYVSIPYPSMESCQIWTENDCQYLRHSGPGEHIDHMARVSYLGYWRSVYFYGDGTAYPVLLDDRCYEEYAQHLIPRAVGYSSQLLKYFFRGTIDIDSFYASDSGSSGSATIQVNARNTAGGATGTEEMSSGEIKLVIHYLPSDRDDSEAYDYFIIPEATGQRSIGRNGTTLSFNLGSYPPPLFSEKCTFHLVYRGQLGTETDAVCAGFAKNNHCIDISLPDTGVYALQATEPVSPRTQGFGHIKLLARNTGTGNEDMSGGSIQLVLQYRLPDDNPFVPHSSYPNPFTHRVRYLVAHTGTTSIPRDGPVELDFDLGADQLPLWAYDVSLYVVFRKNSYDGSKGVQYTGFKNISEPTPFSIFNHMDKVKLFGRWYETGSDAMWIVDDRSNGGNGDHRGNEHPVYPRYFENVYVRFSPSDGPARYASSAPGEYNTCIPRVGAGHYVMIYILSDYNFNYSLGTIRPRPHYAADTAIFSYYPCLFSGRAFRKEVLFNPDSDRYEYHTPGYLRIRGIDLFGQSIYCHIPGYPGWYNIPFDEICMLGPDMAREQ